MAAPLTVSALDHFVLRVRDLERSIAFYRDALGLPIECLDEYRAGTRPFVSARIGDQLLDLVPDPTYDASISGGFLHFCVRVRGALVADVLPRLRALGAEAIDEQPMVRLGATGYGASIYVRDPDGYVVELKEETPA
ncbi:MAG: VOC family protein [Deltaproteobacteria bacterium]|nr:VOC family protein [Deltaproteobacteria bacterium]